MKLACQKIKEKCIFHVMNLKLY